MRCFLEKVEFLTLCALLLVLPTMESPKTIAIVLFALVWTGRRLFSGTFRIRRFDMLEAAVITLLLAVTLSTIVNWPFKNGLKGVFDTLRYVLVFLCVYRGNYSESQKITLASLATVGLLLGIAWGVVELAIGARPNLELHSAGVLTQSAIYTSIGLFLVLGVVITHSLPAKMDGTSQRVSMYWLLSLDVIATALYFMGSRGAFIAIAIVVTIFVILVRSFRFWLKIGVIVTVTIIASSFVIKYSGDNRLFTSTEKRFAAERISESNAERSEIWRVAIAQLNKHVHEPSLLLFGIGPKNYESIDITDFVFEPPLTVMDTTRLNHAHSMYLTKLIEEGVVGVTALMLFFGVALIMLARSYLTNRWYDWKWFAALGATLVPMIDGVVNSQFHQEHAILAMAIIAISMSPMKEERPVRA